MALILNNHRSRVFSIIFVLAENSGRLFHFRQKTHSNENKKLKFWTPSFASKQNHMFDWLKGEKKRAKLGNKKALNAGPLDLLISAQPLEPPTLPNINCFLKRLEEESNKVEKNFADEKGAFGF